MSGGADPALAVTVTDTAPPPYPVIRNFGIWKGGDVSSGSIDGPFGKFVRLLRLPDGSAVDPSSYTVTEGSTVITLHESYLKTLANGPYAFRAEFTDGYADLTLTVDVGGGSVIAVTGITLNKSSLSLAIGGSETLAAAVSPADAANQGVTWSSSDASVAAVDANGHVTAHKAGTAVITVTTHDGGFTASCAVTVASAAAQDTGAAPTGDGSNITLWWVLLVGSALGILCVLVWRRARQVKRTG
jgi:uncharacterized protein YjdB